MPDVQEVFRMSTQKIRQDPGALDRQAARQRRAARNKKAGPFVVVATIVTIAVAAAVLTRADDEQGSPPAGEPTETPRILSIVDVGSGTGTAFSAPHGASQFDVTLDGSMVAYRDADENGEAQVFVTDADGSNQRQLTHRALGVALMGSPPEWSPDGSTIAYWVTLPEGGSENYAVRGSDGVSTPVTHEPKDVYEGGWASDGSFVFSFSNPVSAYPLLARSIDLETGETATIARDVSTPEVSSDVTLIAFDSYFRPEGEAWLSLMNIDGTGRRTLLQASYIGSYPRWSPDSTQIAYLGSTDEDGSGTYVFDLAVGEARFVTAGTVESWIDDDHILVS